MSGRNGRNDVCGIGDGADRRDLLFAVQFDDRFMNELRVDQPVRVRILDGLHELLDANAWRSDAQLAKSLLQFVALHLSFGQRRRGCDGVEPSTV